ncbi:MAG: hypothetical protein HY675_06795 [Chloroflexi bacterium]|nr:hypothetical protein [Chloroflexota bacterium]
MIAEGKDITFRIDTLDLLERHVAPVVRTAAVTPYALTIACDLLLLLWPEHKSPDASAFCIGAFGG